MGWELKGREASYIMGGLESAAALGLLRLHRTADSRVRAAVKEAAAAAQQNEVVDAALACLHLGGASCGRGLQQGQHACSGTRRHARSVLHASCAKQAWQAAGRVCRCVLCLFQQAQQLPPLRPGNTRTAAPHLLHSSSLHSCSSGGASSSSSSSLRSCLPW